MYSITVIRGLQVITTYWHMELKQDSQADWLWNNLKTTVVR